MRLVWDDLPSHVRHAVTDILGGEVVEAVSQPGGFSPGTADRVRTAEGRRAFVKAVSSAQNAHSPGLHRREAQVTAALPPATPTPTLLGTYDDGDWIALVLTDVDGRHPATPWRDDELAAVRAALDALATSLTPCPIEVPAVAEYLRADLTGWHRLRDDPPAAGPVPGIDALCDQADRALAALSGDTLTHTDIRADNLLIDARGAVTVIDWPHAARGPAWLDTLLLLINVRVNGGYPDLATVDADPADLKAVVAAFAGFFADAARQPPPPGLPTLRAFQQAQADAVIQWLTLLP